MSPGRRTLLLAGATIGAVSILLFRAHEAGRDARLQVLIDAVEGSRQGFVEGRLSGGFRPPGTSTSVRGGARDIPVDVLIAAARLQEKARRTNLVDDRVSSGIGLLIAGATDEALQVREDCLADQPTNARVLNDLSVGYWPGVVATRQSKIGREP